MSQELRDSSPVRPSLVTDTRATPFEATYGRHYRDVHRYVLGLTKSSDEADDVTAETFIRAFRAWPDGGSLVERPLPWLLLTARRIALDRWRRAARLVGLLRRAPTTAPTTSPSEAVEFWMWYAAVSRVLPDRQREVLLLRYQRDLSDDEIAGVMGITRSGVRSLVARAVANLRAHEELLR